MLTLNIADSTAILADKATATAKRPPTIYKQQSTVSNAWQKESLKIKVNEKKYVEE